MSEQGKKEDPFAVFRNAFEAHLEVYDDTLKGWVENALSEELRNLAFVRGVTPTNDGKKWIVTLAKKL